MRATKFVKSYIDAWNQMDPEGVLDHLAVGGTYRDVPANEQHAGDELVTYLKLFFKQNKHRYELIGDVLTGERTIAFQYRVSPLSNPVGAADIYRGAEFMTLVYDAAVTITDYYEGTDIVRPSDITDVGGAGRKYAKSRLSTGQMDDYKDRLMVLMQDEQAFLQPDLTLPKLADAVGCSVNHLSQVINSGLGISFFDFLNQSRIEYAKELLSEQGSHRRAILSVALAAGFNSNSAFYAAFKKCCGVTPAQYRRRKLSITH